MSDLKRALTTRRTVVQTLGQGAALLPVAGLVACGGESEAPSQSAAPPASQQPAPSAPASSPEPAPAPESQAPAPATAAKVTEDDPAAVAIGYKHDVADVDKQKYANYQPGQLCSNCILYVPAQETAEGWGPCTIFQNRLVKAGGWCSVYAPAS